jgi:glycosyltransferase involved in cell wall biosynthesis/ubiquinone/menaquinone biosynthesis C-methylase UbiE
MMPQNDETLEYYKKMIVHTTGILKEKIPRKAELSQTDAVLEAFYSERYADVDVAAFLESERKERLFGLCNMVKPGESFLDIGCADGGHMNVLYQRGIFGIGLDLAVPNVLRGRVKYPHLKFIHGFAEEIPFRDNFFDVVLLGDVIEHFRNPPAVLCECLRVARTSLVICVPIKEEITEEHINPFTIEGIFSLLNLFSLKIVLYNPEGEIISKETAVSGLNEFPWFLIRAEKSDGSADEIKKYKDVYSLEIESRGKTELLANDQWKLGDFHSRDPTEIARFNLVSNLIEGNRVLEIGSGNGDSTISLSKTAGEVVGIDISETGIRDACLYSTNQGLTRLPTFYVMDATALAFPDSTFDTVVIPEVIEHVRSSRKIFQEAIRVVRNGGRIIFSVPDGLLVPWSGHIRIFFKDTLATELSQYSDTISWHDLPFKKWIIGSFFVKKENMEQITGPAIDILMPSYNGRSTIKRAIQSVIDQTYANWNLIVINDGGEYLGDIIEDFHDSRIKYITSEHKGKSHALNIGLRNSDEELITYLDDDDLIYPIHLEELINGIKKENAEFVYVDWYEVSYNEHNIEFWRGIEIRQDVTPDMLITQNYINHKCILHTRKLINYIGGYDEDLSVLIDWDIIRRMAFKGKPVHIWSLTSERIRYYKKNTLINRITGLWTRDKKKVQESVLKIINKTDALGATIDDLNHALNCALTIIPYYQYPRLQELNQDIQIKGEQIQSLLKEVNTKESQLELLKRQLEEMSTQIFSLQEGISSKDQQIVEISVKVECLERQLIDIKTPLEESNNYIKSLEETLSAKDFLLQDLTKRLNDREGELLTIEQSIVWQCTQKFHKKIIERLLPQHTRRRKYYDLVRTGGKNLINHGYHTSFESGDCYLQEKTYLNEYQEWIEKNEPASDELIQLKKSSKNFSYRPKISIITPIWNTDEKILRSAIESVINQIYDNWELCLVDGNSTKPHIKRVLNEYAQKESRIKVKFLPENKGIAGNSNEALALATGDFIGFLDHDDELVPFTLYEVVKLLNQNRNLQFIYSDEDKIDQNGNRKDPFFKPDWSPDLFLSQNYLCHFSVIDKALIDSVGGFHIGYDGSQDYDLFLRCSEKISPSSIAHISKILYHWRLIPGSAADQVGAKPYAFISAKKALEDALIRRGLNGRVEEGIFPSSYRVRYEILDHPQVSIIIPTKDHTEILKRCIQSILEKTEYLNYEIIIVDNKSSDDKTFEYYTSMKGNPKIKIINYDKPFNFSAINNYAVTYVDSPYLVFLNNDTEVISGEWLSAMLEHAQRGCEGAVGAKLLYPNNLIQHAGVVLGITGTPGQKGVAGHSHKNLPDNFTGYFLRSQIIGNYSAVTAACLMMRKDVFNEIGGFNEDLAIAFNDVDLCLRIRSAGYLIVYTPYSLLYHHESMSRGYEDTTEKQMRFSREVTLTREHWGSLIDNGDPYYNPNLSLDNEDFSINCKGRDSE